MTDKLKELKAEIKQQFEEMNFIKEHRENQVVMMVKFYPDGKEITLSKATQEVIYEMLIGHYYHQIGMLTDTLNRRLLSDTLDHHLLSLEERSKL